LCNGNRETATATEWWELGISLSVQNSVSPARAGRPGGPARPVRAGLYNFEKPSGRAGPRSFWAGPGRAGLVSKVALTSLIADRGV